MAAALTPAYLGNDFSTASPGMRFGMYFRHVAGRDKGAALNDVVRLNPGDAARLKALIARQSALRARLPEDGVLHLSATTVSPLTTGLGNAHPLENGFAFLNPYGLPYLPGSGIKGVLRRAARELAEGDWGDGHGWLSAPLEGDNPKSWTSIDVLFGRETDADDRLRGTLSFWDAIPQVVGGKLHVEVMTPHQSHYYVDGESPHDSGQPNPILFLTVPPESTFDFHVVCDLAALRRRAPALAVHGRWKELVSTAFEHAFTWLGFGAKTAIGYGAMKAKGGKAPAADALQQVGEVWENAQCRWDPGRQELSVASAGKRAVPVKGNDAVRSLFADGALFERLMRKKELSGIRVAVTIAGNQVRLHKIL